MSDGATFTGDKVLGAARAPASAESAVRSATAADAKAPSVVLTLSCPDTTGIVAAVAGFPGELLALARCMQILTADACAYFNGSKTVVLR